MYGHEMSSNASRSLKKGTHLNDDGRTTLISMNDDRCKARLRGNQSVSRYILLKDRVRWVLLMIRDVLVHDICYRLELCVRRGSIAKVVI